MTTRDLIIGYIIGFMFLFFTIGITVLIIKYLHIPDFKTLEVESNIISAIQRGLLYFFRYRGWNISK